MGRSYLDLPDKRKVAPLVVLNKSSCSNFGVKAAEIAERKFIRIVLIRMNLRSLAVDDLSALSRSKLHQELLLRTTSHIPLLRKLLFSYTTL
jgi:hypothetical protein